MTNQPIKTLAKSSQKAHADSQRVNLYRSHYNLKNSKEKLYPQDLTVFAGAALPEPTLLSSVSPSKAQNCQDPHALPKKGCSAVNVRGVLQAPATVYTNFSQNETKLRKNIGTDRLEISSNDPFFNPTQSTFTNFKPVAGDPLAQANGTSHKTKQHSLPKFKVVTERGRHAADVAAKSKATYNKVQGRKVTQKAQSKDRNLNQTMFPMLQNRSGAAPQPEIAPERGDAARRSVAQTSSQMLLPPSGIPLH